MEEYDLSGAPSEMGHEFAVAVEEEGKSLVTISADPADPSQKRRERARESVPIVRDHFPGLLDEIDAIADGLDADREQVRCDALAFGGGLGCSLIGLSGEHTASGKPVFGRNHDWKPSTRKYAKLFYTRPSDGFASVGATSRFVGRHDGVNESGLAIAFSGVPRNDFEPGVMWALAIRGVLDHCATVQEAVDLLEDIPHAYTVNFLIADAHDELAIVEASPDAVQTTRPENGIAIATNQFASESMRKHQDAERRPIECPRFRALEQWAADAEAVTIEDLQTILGDPDSGVCWPLDVENDAPESTTWSWTMELSENVAYLARDSPVKTSYERVSVPRSAD